jgi:F1F0 ATPase subunit 2
MMIEAFTLLSAWVAGVLLGAVFFGGLWWTVARGLSSKHPGLWFLGSLLLRTSITATGFVFVASGHWERLLVCLIGFIMARLIVIRLAQPPADDQPPPPEEACHAS